MSHACRVEKDFEDTVGSAAENSPDHLRNGLWAASQLFSTGSSRANKRLLIFTRDEDPAGTGSKAESHRCPSFPLHQYFQAFTVVQAGHALPSVTYEAQPSAQFIMGQLVLLDDSIACTA